MKIRNWLKGRLAETQGWSRRGIHFFVWVATILLAILLLWVAKAFNLTGKVDDNIRWLACAFELSGVFLVIAGIDKSRRAFGRPSIFGSAHAWFKDARYVFVTRPPTTTTLIASGAAFVISTGNVRIVAHGSSVEEQLEWLKRQISEVNDRVDAAVAQIKEQNTRIKFDIEAEATARANADKALMIRLEDSMIGDFSVELLGAGYLIVGLILSNLTQETAAFGHWLWSFSN